MVYFSKELIKIVYFFLDEDGLFFKGYLDKMF